MPDPAPPILVVGGTGALGRQVIAALLARGARVRALVRPGSNASAIEGPGVTVVRGDMMDPASLTAAMQGVEVMVTSAIGYSRRRKTDSEATDTEGNRNLAKAARAAGLKRVVFTGILNSHLATAVPHFHNKSLAEQAFKAEGVPLVSLRPGAFLDQILQFMGKNLRLGMMNALHMADVPITFVLSQDVAALLAEAALRPDMPAGEIDIGWDRPVSLREVGRLAGKELGIDVRISTLPRPLMSAVLGIAGLFNASARDMAAMLGFFRSGRYVADTAAQRRIFGTVPTAEDRIAAVLRTPSPST